MSVETNYIAQKLENPDFQNALIKCKTYLEGFINSDIMRDDFFAYLQVESVQPCEALRRICMLNFESTTNLNNDNESSTSETLEKNQHLTPEKKLQILQSKCMDMLDTQGFSNVHKVFTAIKKSDFEYNDDIFKNLQKDSLSQLVRLDSVDFIAQVRIFIGTLQVK